MRRKRDEGSLHWVAAAVAGALAAVVLYYAGRNLLASRPVAETPAAYAPREAPVAIEDGRPGMSPAGETVSMIPPLLIQKTGRPVATSKPPPPPPRAE